LHQKEKLFILAKSSEKNGKYPMLQDTDLIEFTVEQEATIKQAFKVEHLKDELALNKMFDYDFNFDDE